MKRSSFPSFTLLAAAMSAGTLLTTMVSAQVPGFTSLVEFTGNSGSHPGSRPYASLIQASDGDFYGTTARGGSADLGSVFRVTASGTFTSLRSFTGAAFPTGGLYPVASLAEHTDGTLYGTTSGDIPSGSYGIIFRMSASGSTFNNLVFFSGVGAPNKGSLPLAGMVRAPDGNFYGTTQYGGAANKGTLYRLTPAGVLTTLVEFTGNGSANKGEAPNAQLVDAGDGYLYGSTYAGGATGFGTLFRFRLSNNTLTTLVNFTGTSSPAPGKFPIGTMLLASDGHLYGTTVNGGGLNAGVVYRLNRGTGTATAIVEFTDASGNAQGAFPAGGLAQGNDGHLYGTTVNGGPGDHGTIYRVTLAGVLTARLIDFTGTSGAAKGEGPYAGLIKAADGRIYGTTQFGGAANKGTVFRLDLSANPQAPVVVTGGTTNLTNTSVTLNATVNPQAAPTTWQFEYGATASYGSVIPVTPGNTTGGSTAEAVSISLTGLPAGSTWHYRIKATNPSGTSVGNDATFTTTGASQPPVVVTGAATGVDNNSATLNGTVNPQGSPATWQFEYGLTTAYGATVPATPGNAGSGTSPETVNTMLSGLPPGTTWHYRLKATNAGGTVQGEDQTFTTSGDPLPAQVVTGPATSIAGTSATLTGTVDPHGSAVTWQFEYGTDESYGSIVPVIPGNITSGNSEFVSTVLAGLAPDTTYHYRLTATNTLGTVLGSGSSFTTKKPPAVITQPAIGITTTNATLKGTVNPNGAASSWQFEYGPDASYGLVVPALAGTTGSGTGAETVTFNLTGLTPGSTWHYRLKATNSAGTTLGEDLSFTTSELPELTILDWRQEYFGTTADAGNAANSADPDRDGVVNLLEYGFGMNPTIRDAHLQPVPTYNGSILIASFNQPPDVNDVTYSAEVSTNLINWSGIADSGSGMAHTFASPVSAATRHYMRLKVTLDP